MKKILISFLSVLFFVPLLVGAVDFENPLEYDTFAEFVDHFGNWMFTLALAIVPLAVVVGAVFILTSAGDASKWQKGRDIILYAVIGLFILLFARGIVGMVKNFFSGSSSSGGSGTTTSGSAGGSGTGEGLPSGVGVG